MTSAYRDLRKAADEHEVDLRTAAFMVAVQRVAEAMELRGSR